MQATLRDTRARAKGKGKPVRQSIAGERGTGQGGIRAMGVGTGKDTQGHAPLTRPLCAASAVGVGGGGDGDRRVVIGEPEVARVGRLPFSHRWGLEGAELPVQALAIEAPLRRTGSKAVSMFSVVINERASPHARSIESLHDKRRHRKKTETEPGS
jgi:hypothetical protein